jgi:CheY-like chemotaxis protein
VEGTGIGLALSRHLAEAMGGRMGVQTEPGRGATFWIDMPLGEAPAGEAPSETGAGRNAGPALQVLYIEDNVANLRVVEAMLRLRPALRLTTAMRGEHGLELARRLRPDVILLDIHLPGLDGYAVLEALRGDGATRDIPVIALSADAMPAEIERGRRAGFVHYLTKPVIIDHLFDALDGALRS